MDNDPMVRAHARALLRGSAEGATAYLPADIRDTDKILKGAAETLDFSEPVAVMALMVLQYVPDDDLRGVMSRLPSQLPAGSHLTVSDTVIASTPSG